MPTISLKSLTRTVSIAVHPTASESARTVPPAKPDANLRAELLGQLAAAQFGMEATVAELRRAGNAGMLARGEAGLANLITLQRSVSLADPVALAAMRGEIAATVATVAANAEQARSAAGAAAAAEAARGLAEASTASRREVQAVMASMRDFDPYLHFASADDERAYREREAERRAYIEKQQAKNTPQGDLNAAGAALHQLDDAKAHGADASPDFARRYAALSQAKTRLADAIHQSPTRASTQPDASKEASSDLNDAAAALKAAGVQTSSADDSAGAITHGLAVADGNRSGPTSARA